MAKPATSHPENSENRYLEDAFTIAAASSNKQDINKKSTKEEEQALLNAAILDDIEQEHRRKKALEEDERFISQQANRFGDDDEEEEEGTNKDPLFTSTSAIAPDEVVLNSAKELRYKAEQANLGLSKADQQKFAQRYADIYLNSLGYNSASENSPLEAGNFAESGDGNSEYQAEEQETSVEAIENVADNEAVSVTKEATVTEKNSTEKNSAEKNSAVPPAQKQSVQRSTPKVEVDYETIAYSNLRAEYGRDKAAKMAKAAVGLNPNFSGNIEERSIVNNLNTAFYKFTLLFSTTNLKPTDKAELVSLMTNTIIVNNGSSLLSKIMKSPWTRVGMWPQPCPTSALVIIPTPGARRTRDIDEDQFRDNVVSPSPYRRSQ